MGHPGPVPHCRLFDVERAVSTIDNSLGRGGGGSSREPSLTFPAANTIAVRAQSLDDYRDKEGGERGGISILLPPPSTDTRACNVGVEYVSFFNCYASIIFIYFHHPYSSSSLLTLPSTPSHSNMSGEIPPMAAIPSNPSSASAASLSSSSR
jgi:hypothetical protein